MIHTEDNGVIGPGGSSRNGVRGKMFRSVFKGCANRIC